MAPPVFFFQAELTDARRIREKLPHAHDQQVTMPARKEQCQEPAPVKRGHRSSEQAGAADGASRLGRRRGDRR